MNIDIDQFIREQKSKIADERSYLSANDNDKNNKNIKIFKPEIMSSKVRNLNDDNFVLKMREGENMKNKYKQELRNDFSISNKLNKHMESYSPRREKGAGDTSDDEGLLYGLKYSNSASKRKEIVRNQEYNEFKAMEEEKFKNRFSNKKKDTKQGSNESFMRSNPISFTAIQSQSPPSNRIIRSSQIIPQPEVKQHVTDIRPYIEVSAREHLPTYPKNFESKIDELEKKVEELRNFRIKNPYIIYPGESGGNVPNSYVRPSAGYDQGNSLRYSSTDLGKSHLKYLEETENRLKDIEEKYDLRKSTLMNNYNRNPKKLHPILDDNELFEKENFYKDFRRGNSEKEQQNDSKSIIPTGRENEEEIKRRKQIEYRLQLESQMKEKPGKTRSSEKNENNNFFDRFGSKEVKKTQNAPVKTVDQDNDYFFYASHNPLDEYDVNVSPSFVSSYPVKVKENIKLREHGSQMKNRNDVDSFFGERDNQSRKENYRDELMKQIEESKVRKEMEKKKLEDYERRKNEEIARYEPFGRGGGGAPLRNEKGETITDLKKVIFDPDVGKKDPPSYKPIMNIAPEYIIESSVEPPNSQRGFARGGHGIFGKALTDEDKVRADKYKDELKLQIEENKKQKDIEKEKERLREENERIKFEREQKQIQIELENEKKKQQEKEIERLRLLEESQAEAFKEKEKKKIENEKKKTERIFSPIVRKETPRVERVTPRNDKETILDKSKLEIEATSRAQIHREDSKIMSQLYKLKNQLESEKLRVEQALIRQKDEVEIYDPRLDKNNPFKNGDNGGFNSDVFQAIVDNKKPLTFRRDHLKNKPVMTTKKHKNTEADLDEYLKQQEKLLERMNQKDFSKLELMMPQMEPKHVGLRPGTSMSNQLESDSAFIHFDQSSDFQMRNSHSQASESEYTFTKPRSPKQFLKSEFGSNTSLNIDELTRKNQQRLRKLQKLQDENGSYQSSEDILHKVVSSHNNDSDLFNGLK